MTIFTVMNKYIINLLLLQVLIGCLQDEVENTLIDLDDNVVTESINELDFIIDQRDTLYSFDTIYTNIRNDTLHLIPEKIYQATYFRNNLTRISELNSEGEFEGVYYEFHREGNIYIKGIIKFDHFVGIVESFSREGILISRKNFANDGNVIEEWEHPQLDSIISADVKNFTQIYTD